MRSTNTYALTDIGSGIATIMKNRQILSLGIASCVFESSMYLFVFFWSAALEHARKASVLQDIGMDAGAQVDTRLPFGLIFSSFMCAMLTGSSVFSLSLASSGPARDMAASMLMLVLVMTSIGFSGSALLEHSEKHVFWAMCLIEACAGAYFPSISMLKSKAVEDGNRGRIYSLLRVPTNIIVVLAHAMDEEGECAGVLSPFRPRKTWGVTDVTGRDQEPRIGTMSFCPSPARWLWPFWCFRGTLCRRANELVYVELDRADLICLSVCTRVTLRTRHGCFVVKHGTASRAYVQVQLPVSIHNDSIESTA